MRRVKHVQYNIFALFAKKSGELFFQQKTVTLLYCIFKKTILEEYYLIFICIAAVLAYQNCSSVVNAPYSIVQCVYRQKNIR